MLPMIYNLHHPPHIFLDNTWYMVTARIFNNHLVLKPTKHKGLFRDLLLEIAEVFGFNVIAWVILDNHYHILLKCAKGEKLTDFFRRLHGRSAFEFNKLDHARGRQVWHNYWDTCIRDEIDYWIRFNYIHHNPVKHGYVKKMEEWSNSSYLFYLEEKGKLWMDNVVRSYPIIDFTATVDDF